MLGRLQWNACNVIDKVICLGSFLYISSRLYDSAQRGVISRQLGMAVFYSPSKRGLLVSLSLQLLRETNNCHKIQSYRNSWTLRSARSAVNHRPWATKDTKQPPNRK